MHFEVHTIPTQRKFATAATSSRKCWDVMYLFECKIFSIVNIKITVCNDASHKSLQ